MPIGITVRVLLDGLYDGITVFHQIGIPIFTSQLEKAREATDEANLRAAYAVAAAAVLEQDVQNGVSAGPVKLQQKNTWEYVGDTKIGNAAISGAPASGNVYVNVSTDGSVTLTGSATSGYTVVDPVNGQAASTGGTGTGTETGTQG